MAVFARDLRLAARSLSRSPGLAAAAIACLALGLGGTAAVWSLIDTVLLAPLPYRDPDRLVTLWGREPTASTAAADTERQAASAAELADYRRQADLFAGVAAVAAGSMSLVVTDHAERVTAARVSPELFSLLGRGAAAGRVLAPGDERWPERPAVVADGFARRYLGGPAAALGRSFRLGGDPYTVVGVMPGDFHFRLGSLAPELWVPLIVAPEQMAQRDLRTLPVLARLRPEVSPARARAAAGALAERFRRDDPAAYPAAGWRIEIVPLKELIAGDSRPALLALAGAMALVLLIAAVDVAHLLLARAAARERESALRLALGAGRADLLRPFLAEALLLAGAGCALGLLLAGWALQVLATSSQLASWHLPRTEEIGLDARTVAFAALLSLAAGLTLGLFAGSSGIDSAGAGTGRLQALLREGGRGGAVRGRLQAALVVAEVAVALVVLVGAGLLAESVLGLARVDPGFRADRLLTLRLFLPPSRYSTRPQQAAAAGRLLERLRRLPGVARAGLVGGLPLSGFQLLIAADVEGRTGIAGDGAEPLTVDWRQASPGYVRAMGIPLLAGRELADGDGPGRPEVALVDEVFARRAWAGQDLAAALGRRLKLRRPSGEGSWLTVVGVTGHVLQAGLDDAARGIAGPQVLTPLAQAGHPSPAVVLRAAAAIAPASLAAGARRTVAAVDPEIAVDEVLTMEERLDAALAGRRAYALLVGLFAGTALLLAAVGVYGVTAHAVSRRVREIGIRMALGARPGAVRALVVRRSLAQAGLGVVLGFAGALAASRGLASLLYGVGPFDPATFAAAAGLLLGLAGLAAYLPARRATRIDPLEVLRWE